MKRFYVFRPRKNGDGYITNSFDTEKEAKHFASLFKTAYIKELY